MASAMRVHPSACQRLSRALRSAASACGAAPARTWPASSPSVTSRGLLTLKGLVAADQALVPVAPGGADAREVGGLLAALDRLRASRRAPRLASTGVVVTQGGGKTAAIAAMVAGLVGEGEAPPVLGEAPAAPTGRSTGDYAALAERLLARP